jgi:hypothetical protein
MTLNSTLNLLSTTARSPTIDPARASVLADVLIIESANKAENETTYMWLENDNKKTCQKVVASVKDNSERDEPSKMMLGYQSDTWPTRLESPEADPEDAIFVLKHPDPGLVSPAFR